MEAIARQAGAPSTSGTMVDGAMPASTAGPAPVVAGPHHVPAGTSPARSGTESCPRWGRRSQTPEDRVLPGRSGGGRPRAACCRAIDPTSPLPTRFCPQRPERIVANIRCRLPNHTRRARCRGCGRRPPRKACARRRPPVATRSAGAPRSLRRGSSTGEWGPRNLGQMSSGRSDLRQQPRFPSRLVPVEVLPRRDHRLQAELKRAPEPDAGMPGFCGAGRPAGPWTDVCMGRARRSGSHAVERRQSPRHVQPCRLCGT
jgi:hypothetical protein